jgi:hypothetical protein
MTTQPQTARGAVAPTHPDYWINVTAEDIPHGWIDNMVKRLFDELNRQMIRVEKTSCQESDKKDHEGKIADDPDKREKSARILARLQTSLERLTQMEMERAALRTTKTARTRTDARAAIRRRILAKSEPGPAGDGTGDPQ